MKKILLVLSFVFSFSVLAEEESLGTTALGLFKTGGPLMYPLAFCSCLVVWLAVYSFFETRKGKFVPRALLERLEAALFARDLGAAAALFVMFYPLESGIPMAESYARHLRWFKWYNY